MVEWVAVCVMNDDLVCDDLVCVQEWHLVSQQ